MGLSVVLLIPLVARLRTAITISIPSACNHKDNGLYYIKPTETGAVIPVICNQQYTMLDASLNYDSLSTYFTSIYRYGDDDTTVYGTDCSDFNSWRNWYSPANENTKFRIAKNCNECEAGEVYGENTAYYMTNGYFCPVPLDIDGCSSTKDLTEQTVPDVMCNVCDDQTVLCGDGSTGAWCDCFSLQLSADHMTTKLHKEYCQQELNWRPVLGDARSQCTCYKPLDAEVLIYDNIEETELPALDTQQKQMFESLGLHISPDIQWESFVDTEKVNAKTCQKKDSIYLSNEDFVGGTYRITECGNYILTEDIVVNFNKPSRKFDFEAGDSPNSIYLENLPWFPTTEQQDSGEYFGLNAFWGPYSIGFMAAITIETSHVYIDLNGYSISMDYEFYLQQRFFAIIELSNKQFEARQGPVDFGRDDICSKDISVKDGTLGLSSHHGIHGSCVKDVTITNLQISHFDVTGLQCNGCMNMDITASEIGPQNIDIPVKGRYTHGRIMLARLRYLVDEYGEESIQFANREQATTVRELANRLIEQMDMVYYNVIEGVQFADDNQQWMAAKTTFMNPTGWMDGGSSYGILLNGFGTAVVNIGRRTGGTFNINIKDVEIHNIKNKPFEGFWSITPVPDTTSMAVVHGFFFETIDWLYGNVYDKDTGHYLGDAYTDILFAANRFFGQEPDYCPLGSLFYLDGLSDWAFVDGTDAFSADVNLNFACGSDIQSHSAKGAIGIRIDGVQGFSVENVHIHDIVNWGDLGSDACGEYEKITFEKGVDVDKDIQYGYTGTKVHGILTDYASGDIINIKIENLRSLYGSAVGIALYKGSVATLSGYIKIEQISAGTSLTKAEALQLILPNPIPFVCSVLIGPNSDSDTNPENTPVIQYSDDFAVTAHDLYGYDHCSQDQRVGVMGKVNMPQINDNVKVNMSWQNNSINSLMIFVGLFIVIGVLLIFKGKNKKSKILNNPQKQTETEIEYKYGSF